MLFAVDAFCLHEERNTDRQTKEGGGVEEENSYIPFLVLHTTVGHHFDVSEVLDSLTHQL